MLRRIVLWPLLLVLVVAMQPHTVDAQSHFTSCVSITGSSASVIIPAVIWPTINGEPIAEGDEIAVFTTDGICTGVTTWSGLNAGITIWGDNPVTTGKDGFLFDEALAFRVWDASAKKEYTNVAVAFSSDRTFHRATGTYVENAIYSLSSLVAESTLKVPVPPSLDAPIEGAYIQSSQVTLSWHAVADAESYQVQVATDTLFTSTVASASGLTTTSYTASGLILGNRYYWRVRASNVLGSGQFSARRSFWTKQAPPDTPVLASPADGASNLPVDPTLAWHPSSGASTYDVQISGNAVFTNILWTAIGITGTGYVPEGLGYQKTYYWRVQASNSTGTSEYSEGRSFSTAPPPPKPPMLRTPSNAAADVAPPVAFSWKSVNGASSYDLQVARDEAFGSLVVRENGITGVTHTAEEVSSVGTYFWRARSVSSYGIPGEWASSFMFTLADDSGPIVADPIEDQKRGKGHGAYKRDLDSSPEVFTTSDQASKAGSGQGVLRYSATSSHPQIAAVELDDSELTIAPGEPGTALITVTASDDLGNVASHAFLFSVSQSSNMIIQPDRARLLEDQSVAVNVLMNDGFMEGSVVTPTIIEPAWNGTATMQGGKVHYTPVRDYSGLDSLVYRVHDEQGNWGQAKVYFSVIEVDDPPVFANPNAIIRPGTHQHIVVGREPGAGFDLEGHPATDPEGEEVLYAWEISLTEDFLSPIYTSEYGPSSHIFVGHDEILPVLKQQNVEPGGYLNTLIRLVATDGTVDAVSPTRWITFVRDVATSADSNEMPEAMELRQNYPNPFNPRTTISYRVAGSGPVELIVYDILGKEVARLVDSVQPAGAYDVAFEGDTFPSGVYVYRLSVGGEVRARSMILAK